MLRLLISVRLSGVPTPNYGMVQLSLSATGWTSVCDVGFEDIDAKVVCKSLGYKDGKAQCCSALGSKLIKYSPIGIYCIVDLYKHNAFCKTWNYVLANFTNMQMHSVKHGILYCRIIQTYQCIL